MTELSIPLVNPDDDTLGAAFKYAAAGWYLVPVDPNDRKNPGSILGKGWQTKSSRDTAVIASWFAGTNALVGLHCGRSGAWVADVDHPDNLPGGLAEAIRTCATPHQSSRPDQPGRGHYVFLQPHGRVIGNGAGQLGKAWGEGRGRNGIIMACPSRHAAEADGARYEWLQTGVVPQMTADLAAALPDSGEPGEAATDVEVARFVAEHTAAQRPTMIKGVLAGFHKALAEGGARHNALVDAACWGTREAMVGLYSAADIFTELIVAFITAQAVSRDGIERTLTPTTAAAEAHGVIAWAVAQATLEGEAAVLARVRKTIPNYTPPAGPTDTPPADLLHELLKQLRTWQDLPDPTHIYAALAVAVTAGHDGEPAWLLLVAAPSSGKTETVRVLDGTADAHLDEVTVAGLLSWTKRGKAPKPTGVLTRVTTGLVTFGDLSTLLATSDKGGRDQVFALLRRVYDGEVVRDVGAPSGAGVDGPLSWKGRLTIVGAVTGAIDTYSTHADALGSRWLYCRLPDRDIEAKRRAATLARHGGLNDHRKAARDLAAQIVVNARGNVASDVPDRILDAIEDAALVCCWGRASVPRHGYGAREIDGPVTVEEPMRVVRQLDTVARSLLALGCTTERTMQVCRRLALDSMPAARRAVLGALTLAVETTTLGLARAAKLDRKVTRRVLEDLEAIGVVRSTRKGALPDEDAPDRRHCTWYLDRADGELIAAVITTEKAEGCSEKGEPYTPTPQITDSHDEEGAGGTPFSEHPQQSAPNPPRTAA